MTGLFVLFQVWMLIVDAIAVFVVQRRPTPLVFFETVVLGGFVLLASAVAFTVADGDSRSMFVTLGYLASGIFLHGVFVLTAGWWLLRREHGTWARLPASCAFALVLIGVDAFAIEPVWLELTRYSVETERLSAPVRIAVVADFQTDHIGAHERGVLRLIAAEQPDLVLLPGDYVHVHDRAAHLALRARLNGLLHEYDIRPPLGVHAVRGNTEWPEWEEIFAGIDGETYDRTHTVQRGELSITGLSLGASFDPELVVERQPGFHLVFGHAPDFALGDVDADLLVAGHTHGGQVQLPFIGPLVTLSQVPRSWADGRTELEGGRTLVVSRGIGMERDGAPRLRFLCRPELVFIELVPTVSR